MGFFEGLVLIGYVGQGWYSGAEAFTGFLCPKDCIEEVKEDMQDEYTFSDLDGKHGHVGGDLVTLDGDEMLEVIADYGVSKFGVCDGLALANSCIPILRDVNKRASEYKFETKVVVTKE